MTREITKSNRREFLAKTAALGAGITILANPRSARTAEANERILLGLIGCGARSARVCDDMLRRPSDNVRLKYCCDVDLDRANQSAQRYKRDEVLPETVQDARTVIDDPSVDGVVLVTPDHWHALHTLWACEAGKDVFCEKPLSRTAFEGEMMVAAAKKYNRVVAAGNLTRSAPYCLTAKKFIDDGELGKIEFVRVNNIWQESIPTLQTGVPVPESLDWDRWIGPSPWHDYSPTFMQSLAWGNFWDFGNGLLATQGVHQIDLARWILGLHIPKSCYSLGGIDKERLLTQPPATQTVNFDFGRLIMCIDQTMNTPAMLETDWEVREKDMHPYWFQNSTRIEIYGTKYMMVIGRLGAGWQVFDRTKQRQPVVKAEDFGHYSEFSGIHMTNFIDCMRSRQPAHSPVEECHKSTMLILYANMSLRAGSVKLDIDTETGKVTNAPEVQKFWRPEFRRQYDIPEMG